MASHIAHNALQMSAIALTCSTENKKREDCEATNPFVLREGERQQGVSHIAHNARERAIALKTTMCNRMETRKMRTCDSAKTHLFVLENNR